MSDYVEGFILKVLKLSDSNEWEEAKDEWEIDDYEVDPNCSSECICGHQGIKFLYTIKNTINGNIVNPVGSSCVKKFERDDFDYSVLINESYLKIIKAVENKEFLSLKGGLFSRKLINYLYEKEVFKPSKFNGYDSEKDRDFLIDMFNKKKELTENQEKKVRGLIGFQIVPYIKSEIEKRTIS